MSGHELAFCMFLLFVHFTAHLSGSWKRTYLQIRALTSSIKWEVWLGRLSLGGLVRKSQDITDQHVDLLFTPETRHRYHLVQLFLKVNLLWREIACFRNCAFWMSRLDVIQTPSFLNRNWPLRTVFGSRLQQSTDTSRRCKMERCARLGPLKWDKMGQKGANLDRICDIQRGRWRLADRARKSRALRSTVDANSARAKMGSKPRWFQGVTTGHRLSDDPAKHGAHSPPAPPHHGAQRCCSRGSWWTRRARGACGVGCARGTTWGSSRLGRRSWWATWHG